jgi:membrane protein implicated in regulation of membrane protease activity
MSTPPPPKGKASVNDYQGFIWIIQGALLLLCLYLANLLVLQMNASAIIFLATLVPGLTLFVVFARVIADVATLYRKRAERRFREAFERANPGSSN